MSLGKRILEQREALGMNQKQLADACGLTQATISRLEGEVLNELKSEALKRIASALGVTTDYLVGKTSEMQRSALLDTDSKAKFIFRGYEKLPEEGRDELKGFVDYLLQKNKSKKEKDR